ncbi:hypothetical protein [Pareuzebyella sediminis]|uniref:hypothetical protein n=1 Tax=Pareuzebyella sediminis TaxID=2607998 RepID=UPI0011EE9879|nr:hypothetical protein [Pareuzebyella sediminis]
MAATLTNNTTISDLKQESNNLENIVVRLYSMKNRFESNYYGGQISKKYDRARSFTIRINIALYHAHQMKRKVDLFEHNFTQPKEQKVTMYFQKFNQNSDTNYSELEKELDSLGKELIELIQ